MTASTAAATTRQRNTFVGRILSSPSGLAGLVLVGFWVLAALLAPVLLDDPASRFDPASRLQAPSTAHWFGTDALGRDVLARTLVAARLTFLLTFGAVAISLALGLFFGVLAAVLGSTARQVLYQLTSAAMAFPSIILALLLATLVGRSGIAAMIGLAIAGVPSTARLVLNLTSTVAGTDYVASARMLGVPRWRLMARHVVPNVAEPIVTLTVVTMGSSLMMMAAISFLGIGVQQPQYDWGGMISEGLQDIYTTPWTTLGPAFAIVSAGVGFSLLGEKIAEMLDPRALAAVPGRALRRRATTTVVPATSATAPVQVPQAHPSVDAADDGTIVAIRNLRVHASGPDGARRELVRGVDLRVRRGERVGIVGESGSGKSLSLSALAHMLPGSLSAEVDEHAFLGQDLRGMRTPQLRRLIGAKMPMIFQDPMSSLNPARTIGSQMRDKLSAHTALGGAAARRACIAALESVGIPEPARRLRQHPHELSGGQRQRVMIAMATLGDPRVILADEPTTALDVSVQAQVVEVLRQVNERDGVAIVMVSHDLALVSQLCERVVVMYDGRIVEEGPVDAVIANPQHPYTQALLGAVPDLSEGTDHVLTTITDYSWNTDEYRREHPVPRHDSATETASGEKEKVR